MKCKICSSETRLEFSQTILGRYSCAYFYCDACGFLQTEEPYWLDEAYGNAISDADTGLVVRNLYLSKRLICLLYFLFGKHGAYLDVAGGYGMLTRLMRDIGFDFYWSDKYCKNLLARGFEGTKINSPFTAVTAFEVLEHISDPLDFIKETMTQAKTRTVIFSTELFAGSPPKPDSWWYYAFETGQHISFFQCRTLQIIAEKLGLKCYSSNSFHIFTDRKINPWSFKILTRPDICRFFSWFPKFFLVSKTMTDHLDIMRREQ